MAVKGLGKAVEKTVESVKDKLAPTAVALGLMAESEEAEAAYIPLKAFAEGSEAAQALFKKAQKRIAEGADTRPNGELYNEMGVYRSEDGDLKVDVAELRARNVESLQGLQKFADDLDFYLSAKVRRKKKLEHPITRYLPEDSPIFENFPELKDVKVSIRPQPKNSNYLGEYDTNTNELIVYADNDPRIDYSEFEDERANKILNSFNTLIHEFQHYIQDVKKSANTGYNEVASLVASKGFREDYKDAVEALKNLQPGDIGYDQFKNKVDSVFGMVEKSLSARKKSKDAPSPRDEFISADFDERLKTVERVFDVFEKGSSNTDELLQTSQLSHNIYIRELGEAEARSSGLKALIPEGSERKAIGVFYPTSSGKQTVLRAEDVSLKNRLDPSHVLVRAIPAYEDFTDMNKLYFPESVMGLEAVDPEIVTQAKKKSGDAGKGTAAVVAGGTAAGLASPPSEAFVEKIGETTGLFEDASPTPSLFDVEGVSDELGISNTFLLDLLVPRTKPYDLISSIPGVGETMMATDVIESSFGDYLRGEGTEAGQRIRAEANQEQTVTDMRQGGGIETEAGKEMAKEKFQLDERKADLDKDGQVSSYEKIRGEAIQRAMGEGKENKMAMGGMMGMMADPFAPLQVTVDIDEESGNEVPAGSKDEEVRDDIPAMLSEGEYVVPADVVRYHGLKTFEELRSEAKHALGLMAMHDRISFVDDETKEPVDYDIKEKDLPEVEKAEVEVVEAAEGTDVQPATDPTTFYQLQYKTDPVTGQVRIVYIDPLTGEEVRREEYEEERASRFAPQALLEREVFSEEEAVEEAVEEAEEETACPPGFVRSPSTGACVPIDQDSGDGPTPTPPVPYAEQLTTKIAERLGPLSAEDLADQEGATLADKAVSRMMEPSSVGPGRMASSVLGGPAGMLTALGINQYDAVGAKRAALTRAEEFAADPTAYGAYNFTFDPATGAFKQTKATTRILDTEDEYGVTTTDYNSFGQSGKEYTRDDVFAEGQDPFDKNTALGDVFAGIEDDFDALTEVTGASPGNEPTEQTTGTGSGVSASTMSDDDKSTYSGYMNEGGYVARKNKPRVAMMKY